jgi:hypothetical protein
MGRTGVDGAAEDPVGLRLRPSPAYRVTRGRDAARAPPLLLYGCWRRDGRRKGEVGVGMRMRLPV